MAADALGLGNVQLSLDAACASSVYSNEASIQRNYLNTGKADMMLAGAVSGAITFFINGFHPSLTLTTVCRFRLIATVRSVCWRRCGCLVLKRLADAERDGDNIYAVVSGIGLSNDGRGQFVLSPNSKGQVAL
ncbi:beta-ketoacyl synthase N-terminal-like domain-containing protein [Vibrio lentus]|nr:beta-ketoacyl synthase N-terminal-like domain-containing protein [Vibrio lentus]